MNVEYLASQIKGRVKGRSIYELASPEQIQGGIIFAAHPPINCLYCGRDMMPQQIQPPGAITKRAMHDRCFAYLRAHYQGSCIVCGYEKQGHQSGKPDIHECVHKERLFRAELSCQDYFVVASAHGLGIRTGIIESEEWMKRYMRRRYDQHNNQRQGRVPDHRSQSQLHHTFDDDAIDGEYWETEQRRPQKNQRGQRMIEHNPPETFTFGVVRPDYEYVPRKK
jgi:hypothetical protein